MSTTSVSLPTTTARAAQETRVAGLPTLLVVLAGTFMVVLDFFIVNVAIPSMQTDLHAGTSSVEMIVAGYALALASGLVVSGRLGDVYGARRMFAIGLALFTAHVGDLRSGPERRRPDRRTDRPGRVGGAAGAAGAGDHPHRPSGPSSCPRAFTAYGLTMGLAAVGGQLIGGLLIAGHLGWQACFLINVPVGVVALALIRGVRPRVAHPAVRQDRRRRCGPGDGRTRRARAAADRGPRARLARVDVAVLRRRRRCCSARSPPTSATA